LEDGTTWLTLADGGSDPRSIIEIEPEPDQEPLAVRSITYAPTPEEYAHNVAIAVDALRRKELDKVVLARSVAGVLGATIDPGALAVRLRRREPICTLYSLPTGDGRRFVGITPELLVRRDGRSAMSHPLAGTIGLPANENPEDYQTWLLNSAKNQHEHAVLGNEVVAQFERFYDRVWADAEPSIVALRTVAHLGTWVHADTEHEVDAPDAVELVRVLHPTAAVGGIPRDVAYALIQTLEQKDRGHYAGPVGWIDSRGDGDWWVGIRGVLVEGDTFEAWAGAGIVSESDPTAEREETKIKLESVLSSLVADRF
jgi:menaquinone-specific isochorismate synthase